MNEYSSVQHNLQPNAQPIRYFELSPEHFHEKHSLTIDNSSNVYDAVFHKISLSSGAYLSPTTHLHALDPFRLDTTVLNFQVGTGKTERLLDYVQLYAASSGYIVFYCAPFLRLLGEIGNKLAQRKVAYFDCTTLKSQGVRSTSGTSVSPQAVVHLMTPDFLLGSGGRKSARQAAKKRTYKEDLHAYLQGQDLKVILVFDEIHEKTKVFDAARLPHLLEWFGLVHKVFVASATFTHDAVEVTKAVSFLTENRISVFQADRVKGRHQARLHLHICAQNYSERDLDGLAGLAEVLQANSHRQFHLLAAYKNLAKKLVEDKTSGPGKALSERNPKPLLLTGDNKMAFDESRSSVGTTFKTGVNITSSEALLIVVLPGAFIESKEASKQGTFSDARPSIVQAFARVRNGGDIHVFMPPFTSYLHNTDYLLDTKTAQMLQSVRGGTITPVGSYRSEQDLFDEFAQLHHIGKQKLAAFKQRVGPRTASAYDNYIGFSSLYDYTLAEAEYASSKDDALEKHKQGLEPFILWMALQDQFTNCSLASITVESFSGATVSLPKEMTWQEYLLPEVKRRLPEYHPSSILEAIETILQTLGENSSGMQLIYTLDSRTSGLKKGSLRELYSSSKLIAEAVYNIAEALVLDAPLKKSTRFNFLIHDANSETLMYPKTQEEYFASIKSNLQDFKGEVLNSASDIAGSLYLAASFTENLSERARQAGENLVGVLTAAKEEVPLLKHDIVPLQGYSKEQLDFWSIALRLLRQELGIYRKQASREGRSDVFGRHLPHYKLKKTNSA